LPVLIILAPFLSGIIVALIRNGAIAWLASTLVAWASLAMALLLAGRVQAEGVVAYAIGGWAPPLGIELRVDHLNALVLTLVTGLAAVTLPFSRTSVARDLEADQHHRFYGLTLLFIGGMLGVTATGDAFNLYVLIEIFSLTSYALVALGGRRD